jgi:hypothetical protein
MTTAAGDTINVAGYRIDESQRAPCTRSISSARRVLRDRYDVVGRDCGVLPRALASLGPPDHGVQTGALPTSGEVV